MTISLPLPTTCSLLQAALWVVRGEPPIPDQIFDAAPLAPLASCEINLYGPLRQLLQALRSGALHSTGKFVLRVANPNWVHHSSTTTIRLPAGIWSWSDIQWQASEIFKVNSEAICNGDIFLDGTTHELDELTKFCKSCEQSRSEHFLLWINVISVQVDVRKLVTLFPATSNTKSSQCASELPPAESRVAPYVPPYVEFMLRAARELDMKPDSRMPKDQIEEWIRLHWPDDLGKFSASKCQYIATFLREPADEKGGHFRQHRSK
jgi:hypothetical protein